MVRGILFTSYLGEQYTKCLNLIAWIRTFGQMKNVMAAGLVLEYVQQVTSKWWRESLSGSINVNNVWLVFSGALKNPYSIKKEL